MKIMNEPEKQIMDNLRTKFRKELAHQLKDMMSNEEFVAGLIYTGKIDDYIGGQENDRT
jgi:hypothetical protein